MWQPYTCSLQCMQAQEQDYYQAWLRPHPTLRHSQRHPQRHPQWYHPSISAAPTRNMTHSPPRPPPPSFAPPCRHPSPMLVIPQEGIPPCPRWNLAPWPCRSASPSSTVEARGCLPWHLFCKRPFFARHSSSECHPPRRLQTATSSSRRPPRPHRAVALLNSSPGPVSASPLT